MATETRPAFRDQLQAQWDQGKFVCVGLDPVYERIPQHIRSQYGRPDVAMSDFCNRIIETTGDIALAFKPNLAFFERYEGGDENLMDVIGEIHDSFPGVPVIGDGKRADIGATNEHYAALFDKYGFDAMTTNPYLGGDTFPSLVKGHEDKGLIVLCRTTNPGSKELQEMPISILQATAGELLSNSEFKEICAMYEEGTDPISMFMPVYEIVAFLAAKRWGINGQFGLVVGATAPEAFAPVRAIAGDIPFLIPGIGTQGGDLEKTLKYAPDSNKQGMIINSGSAIIFASSGEDFAEVARAKTIELDRQIREGLGIA